MAAPQISGAIALLTQAFPDNSPELIAKGFYIPLTIRGLIIKIALKITMETD